MVENILNNLPLLAIGFIVLGVLVFVHELGHFLTAKWCGIRVLAFSLGFGHPLLKKQIGGTEYRLSAIPFGGYVHMAGEHPEDESEGGTDEFRSKPIWQRALVAISGPLANIIFSFILLWVMFGFGIHMPKYLQQTVVGYVDPDSPAMSAGIQPGDSITSVNDEEVNSWEDIDKAFAFRDARNEIALFRNGRRTVLSLSFPPEARKDVLSHSGLHPALPAVIGSVKEEWPANKAGFQVGDSIVSIDGRQVTSWMQFATAVARYDTVSNEPLKIGIRRNGEEMLLSARPRYSADEKRSMLGIARAEPPTVTVRLGIGGAFIHAAGMSWEYATMIFSMLRRLVARDVSPSQLAGPIGIVQLSGVIALGGVRRIIEFMAMIGINLAVINLFPLIITDGGLLLFMGLEAIRGKPLALKHQMLINRIAIAFFITLFVYVTWNDILRFPQLFRLSGQ